MFCTNCGNKLEPDQQFCTQCGSRANNRNIQNNVNNNNQTASSSSNVVWIITTQKKLSLLNIITCYVILYNDRLVLAHLSAELQKAESAKKSAEIKASGIGFFKGSAEMMRYWANYQEKYKTMPISSILAEDPSNIEIPYNMIGELFFQAYTAGDEDDPDRGGILHILLSNGNVIKLKHTISHSNSIKTTLESILGFRARYKK
ncbi:MAG: hypothetical protein BWX97_00497 [Firmicutes bacterium ADurb.Bin146]|nr:MAG: hypothetical protein BWX97_00497 [Firmicutes bacterium ADurb.Bin146]